ncbi:hypothetical protein [Desulfobulbus alkaliphilus]|uniref:hypothetical protein n=1 Tax=Desulfobulbus alkaliphilus TaxID=869814 RepID=UPI0019628CAA|nr:hypothetical protein [Desulfobulbus alkaliphilus]MBM9536102.1 hypothetical protein [Desulfobulbus alkaliphilus]
MINIMTINAGNATGRIIDQQPTCLEPWYRNTPDIVCCQSVHRSAEGIVDTSCLPPGSANMTCGCFVAGKQHANRKKVRKKCMEGLAVFIGTGTWMLNSGSFEVSGSQEDDELTIQFALIRKETVAILVINLQFPTVLRSMKTQMRTLFSHPLFKQRYGAVVVCGDRQPPFNNRELIKITTPSNYFLYGRQTRSATADNKGMLWLLAPREQNIAVTLPHHPRQNALLPGTGLRQPSSLTMAFEVTRAIADTNNRHYLPLSFREQCLGGKETGRLFAAP